MSCMPIRTKLGFGCFLLIAVGALIVGVRYSFSPRIMPYHQEALGVDWDDLGPREQRLMLALLRGAGLAALVTGIAMGTLLFIPFRRGERWARWTLSGLSLTLLIPAARQAATLAAATGAATPWPALLVAILVVLVGFLLAGPVAAVGP
jgi:hypothetical protein